MKILETYTLHTYLRTYYSAYFYNYLATEYKSFYYRTSNFLYQTNKKLII